jgi:CRP/FNR family cyclic AMP-dependent transcriptional regulator
MPPQLSTRQEQVLVALYGSRAFSRRSRRSVRSLVQTGDLGDSRYAGPLAALDEAGLVTRERELPKNWSSSNCWWLTAGGRALAETLGPGPGHERVQLLEADRDLADALDAAALAEARPRSFAEVVSLEAGEWRAQANAAELRRGLGLLVLDGLLSRRVTLRKRALLELLGPGDLLRPWTYRSEPLPSSSPHVSWQVLTPAKLAVLDRQFALRIAAWPELFGVLLDRAVQRSRRLAVQPAIRQAGDVEERILHALWLLAHRWGANEGAGVLLKLPNLDAEAFARIAATKPGSARSAVRRLTDRGLLEPVEEGAWLLRQPTAAGGGSGFNWSAGGESSPEPNRAAERSPAPC